MKEFKRKGIIDEITWRFSRVAMFMIAIIFIIMMYEVFMRYIFESPTIWVNEMTLWMAGWVYLLAGVYAMQQRSHIRIFLLYDIVPVPVKKLFNVLSTLFIVLWVFATVWGSTDEAYDAFVRWEKYDSAWAPPIPAITQPLVLISMVLVGIQAVSNLIMDWNSVGEEHDSDESEEIEELKRAHDNLAHKKDKQ